MKRPSAPDQCKSLKEFMQLIDVLRVEDLWDLKLPLKVYEDDNGFVMLYNLSQAKELAQKYNFKIGTLSISDRGYEREGDSSSRFVSLYTYKTKESSLNVKKFFLYRNNIDAIFEDVN